MYINGFYMIEDDLENTSKDGGVVEDSQGENAPIEKEVKVSEEKEVVKILIKKNKAIKENDAGIIIGSTKVLAKSKFQWY